MRKNPQDYKFNKSKRHQLLRIKIMKDLLLVEKVIHSKKLISLLKDKSSSCNKKWQLTATLMRLINKLLIIRLQDSNTTLNFIQHQLTHHNSNKKSKQLNK